jgi:ABC-2 type transport system ATP-binding protein
LIAPDVGSVSVDGINLSLYVGKVREMIGYVPQKTSLYTQLSGRENLLYFGAMLGLSGNALKLSIDEVCAIVALQDHLDKKVSHYSGGMQKRLNLAIGLLGNPKILYLDEPTVGVDPQTRDIILEALVKLAQEKRMSILYTSHYFQEVREICERVVVLEYGKVIANEPLEVLLDNPLLTNYTKEVQ